MLGLFRSRKSSREHWDQAYARGGPAGVGWYQTQPRISHELIAETGIGREARIIDVGGGASTLVDSLLDAGYQNVTVLDLSPQSITYAKERLGERAGKVTWIEADATTFRFQESVDLWHDRAVFHFLTDAADRQRYIEVLKQTLRPAGHLIISTFGPKAPPKCCNLPVMRYTSESLSQEFGEGFQLQSVREETHMTPTGVPQQFIYCRFRMKEGSGKNSARSGESADR
ncbi:MAG: hypothetical protein A2X56_02370 [Nitrospirae bacterium GWC2_57_13]|jgi:SAM-dependent methyltransferase|nr:MAG: hypothetical protein A2X56_02370 [Nitrospirae bacterium GWC2_57_13]OGW44756.1 MAG: hypothetical protein A2X57_11440 [Nitrospirae bacterium GWD2_57_8]